MVDDADATAPGSIPTTIYTETLARLYWRQGFHTQALDIYRHLIHAQPDNKRLQEQMAALQQQLTGGSDEAAAEGVVSGVLEAMEEEAKLCRQKQARHIMAHLERWLHQLQQQRHLRSG